MYKIKLIVKQGKKQDGTSFDYFKTSDGNGKLVDVRFTKECRNLPSKTSYIFVESKNINLDSKREYPCYWIKKIEKVEDIEYTNNDLPFEKVE